MIEILFWTSFIIIFYTYIGYGAVLYLLIRLKRIFSNDQLNDQPLYRLPEVTILVAAYNEAEFIEKKIANTLSLDYPVDKIKFLFVTDGSDDGTPDIIKKYPVLELMHRPDREGKTKAVHRAMENVRTPVVVFTDANTLLNKEAVIKMVRHYRDEKVGAVAGEKRILVEEKDQASSAGEGIYWQYESTLKKWDSELYSVVGAAGELFSIKTDLYEFIPEDTIIEDFYLTMRIAAKGFKVKYEPEAYALENPSFSMKEEMKRKIRIAAGGIQSIVRLTPLLNFFRHGILTFQYVSHRVLRWTLAPLSLPVLFLTNLLLVPQSPLYLFLWLLQASFYVMAVAGAVLAAKEIRLKVLFVPFYFLFMNYSVFAGFFKFFRGRQSVLWEKAKRI